MNTDENELKDKNKVQKYFIKMNRINGWAIFLVFCISATIGAIIGATLMKAWLIPVIAFGLTTLYALVMPFVIKDNENPSRMENWY